MDLPGIAQALADSAGGDQIAVETVTFPDFALIAHRRDPALRLYSDGLHPSTEGACLSALVIYGRLLASP